MSEAKKNDAPSAEALKRYIGTEGGVDVDPDGDLVCLDDVIDLLARVRREARAEAFEEGAGVVQASSYLDSARIALLALAAKERAK